MLHGTRDKAGSSWSNIFSGGITQWNARLSIHGILALRKQETMNVHLALLLLSVAPAFSGAAAPAAKPSLFDLIGPWEGTAELGKFKVRLVVKLAKSPEGKVSGAVDVPDQGAKDVPVSAILCNYPAVRFEIDPFGNLAFNGTVNAQTNEIAGAFDDGPGGRPISVVFRRLDPSATQEKTRVYTFSPGEARDIRGYWKTVVDSPPNPPSRVGLRIGRAADGTFGVLLDLLDQGSADVVASSVQFTNSSAKFEWQGMQLVFEGKLSPEGDRLAGSWQQNRKKLSVAFERLDQPATVLPANLSLTPEKPDEVRGYWKGLLAVPGTKLRIELKIGQMPDGTFAGTLVSPDQGSGEIVMSGATVTNRAVQFDFKTIHGAFKATLNQEGNLLDGTWEQGGTTLPLKLERAPAPAQSAQR